VILPVTLRNLLVGGRLELICSNGPENWRIGNSADSPGLFFYPEGPLLSPWSGAFWRLQAHKLNLFLTSYEWPQNLSVYLMQDLVPWARTGFVRFGLFVPAGIAGLAALIATGGRKHFLFVSFAATNIAWVVLFFITDRYRMPASACLMVSAAVLVFWTIDKVRAGRWVGPLTCVAAAGILAYVFNTTPGEARIPAMYYEIFAQASGRNIPADMAAGQVDKALIEAGDYLRLMPNDPRASFYVACVLVQKGAFEDAKKYLHRTIAADPSSRAAERARDFLKDLEKRAPDAPVVP
jgi:hypothetical protein